MKSKDYIEKYCSKCANYDGCCLAELEFDFAECIDGSLFEEYEEDE